MTLTANTGGGMFPGIVPTSAPTTQPATRSMFSMPNNNPYPFEGRNYDNMLQSSLESFMNPNSQLMQQAAQNGRNVAAERGGINSSIAAGASQKAALDSAIPLAQSSVAAQLNQEQAKLEDWSAAQGFNRNLAAAPFLSSMNMLQQVSQYGLQDPQLYTPSVISGFNNFFNQNMNDILGRYFGT